MSTALLQVRNIVKDYRALRPLRLQSLDLQPGEQLALLGFDQAAAEVLVNLLTGALLPDAGTVSLFGEPTSAITNAEGWVRFLDQFGLISERAVMLDQLSAGQNLAMPLSLSVQSMPPEVRDAVRGLAGEVGLSAEELERPLGSLPALHRQRVRLGRAVALSPRVLLAEHANAPLSGPDTRTFAGDLARVAATRGMALLVLTANRDFATSITSKVATLQPATGELKPLPGWRRWLP
ncbi:MAG TPA: ATP-binding cassette domain-containing protein [Vicinamibacterales bacterium]|nr:ATP-binding cassette domain-containing protein [Vicinamibacterales bacterium]